MNKRRLSQASLLRLPICFFPAQAKMYQTCSLESGLETGSACGTRAHDLPGALSIRPQLLDFTLQP